jgi:YaaC-like Protein
MSQAAMPIARRFDGWIRLPVSRNRPVMFTSNDIERELWNTLEYYSEVEEVGLNLIQSRGLQPQSLHQEIFKHFRAFVRQAKSYYGSAKTLHYRSSSLLYYYSFLNLVKAYLLFSDPERIMSRVGHGLGYNTDATNTDFQLEVIKVHQGIFPMFYEAQTSNVLSTQENSALRVIDLLSYPSDLAYQYELAGYGNIRILFSLATSVVDRTQNQSWTIIGIPAVTNLDDFLSLPVNFFNAYEEVQIDKNRFALIFGRDTPELQDFRFFQDRTTIPFLPNGIVDLNALIDKISNALSPYFSVHYFDDNFAFELVLPYQDATNSKPFNEALAIYAVMFYLSSLVRYRPAYLEELLNHKPAWLIESFVNSTPETFLRMMVSKIIGIDFVFRRR